MEEHFFKFSNLSKYPEIVHGVSNRSFGSMRFGWASAQEVIRNRQQFLANLNVDLKDVVAPNLVHKATVAIVDLNQKGSGSRDPESAIVATDGLITAERGLYLMVTIADCLPIFLYDATLKIVALVHAGWRGIIDQIIPQTIEKLKTLGVEPQNLIVGIGPGICQRHFVVKKEVLSLFLDTYPSAAFVRNSDGYVDLKKAVLIDLKNQGVMPDNVELTSICPVCHNGIYGSFRQEKEAAPASVAVIGIRK